MVFSTLYVSVIVNYLPNYLHLIKKFIIFAVEEERNFRAG